MGGGIPKPQQPPAPPVEEDKAVQDAAAEARRARTRARGFRSTLLSQAMPTGSPALQSTLGS